MRRAVLCASLCNCRHTLRADDNEELVEAALEHLEHNHPSAPVVGVEQLWEIVFSHAYDIEFAKAYVGGSFGSDEEFGPSLIKAEARRKPLMLKGGSADAL